MTKVYAILLSPLVGSLGLVIIFLTGYFMKIPNFYKISFDLMVTIQITAIVYIFSLIIQCIIVEPLIYVCESFFQISVKTYCWLAVFLCLSISFLISITLFLTEFGSCLFICLSYSVGNILTYNELYFKKIIENNDLEY
jgi:hypothetical protein